METQEKQNTPATEKLNHPSDLRIFLIAFLTSVILLALYHFGVGMYAIFCGESDFCNMPVSREYVLVPVSAMPRHHEFEGPCGKMNRFHRDHHGDAPHGNFKRCPGPQPQPGMNQPSDVPAERSPMPPPPPAK